MIKNTSLLNQTFITKRKTIIDNQSATFYI